ncbi:hypothetical protein Tco_1076900 [Tanacetum coccineum]
MSLYSIPHGSTNHSSYSTCPQILRHWEMQPLCYALEYSMLTEMQNFHKVPDTKDTIRFKLNTQEITYTVDMFRDTLKLPVETLENPSVVPTTIEIIDSFMHTIGYQGVVDKVVNCTNVDYAALLWWDFMNYVFQKKDVIQYPRFTKLIIADLMKKYPSIPQRHDEDYHSIKDDIPLEIRATDDYKDYETMFVKSLGEEEEAKCWQTSSPRKSHKITIRKKKQITPSIPPPIDDREIDEIIEATLLSKKDEESYASEFVDSMLNDDVDDFGTRIEPRSHNENPKVIADDDVDKTDDVAEEKDNDDHTDHTLVRTHTTEEMTAPVSPTTATTSKPKNKRGFTSRKIREVHDHCNNIVLEMTLAKTNEIIKEEMTRLVNLTINKDREVDPINVPELHASLSTAYESNIVYDRELPLLTFRDYSPRMNEYPDESEREKRVKTFLFLGGLIPHVSTCYGIIPSLLRTRNQMQDLLDITEDMADFEEHKANTQETRANMEQKRANVKHERANREHDREDMMRTYLMLS